MNGAKAETLVSATKAAINNRIMISGSNQNFFLVRKK
jgi:hypothetical protein